MTTPNPFAPRPPVDPDELLMSGGSTTANFPLIGQSYTGVVKAKRSQQRRDMKDNSLLFWDDGNPQMQIVADLQCEPLGYKMDKKGNRTPFPEDDGMRSLYIFGRMRTAVRDAVRETGAPTIEIGGKLTVTYTGDGEVPGKGMDPPKLYSAAYVPAGQAAADGELMADGKAENPFAD